MSFLKWVTGSVSCDRISSVHTYTNSSLQPTVSHTATPIQPVSSKSENLSPADQFKYSLQSNGLDEKDPFRTRSGDVTPKSAASSQSKLELKLDGSDKFFGVENVSPVNFASMLLLDC